MSAATPSETGMAIAGVDAHPPAPKTDPAQGGFFRRHRRAVFAVLGAVVLAGFFYYVVPRFAGLGQTLRRLRAGDIWWLALGAVLEGVSIAGEVANQPSRNEHVVHAHNLASRLICPLDGD